MSESFKGLLDSSENLFKELIKTLRNSEEPELYIQEVSDMVIFFKEMILDMNSVFKDRDLG